MTKYFMLDLCAGLGGASKAMKQRGWDVTTLDIDPSFNCDITADVKTFHYDGWKPDLVWASPPWHEFAREFMPWCKTGNTPDTSVMLACKRIIDEINPRYWVIENVKGAIQYFEPLLGPCRLVADPFFLWGFFPIPGNINKAGWIKKSSLGSKQHKQRAEIPLSLSRAIAVQIEQQLDFLEIVIND